ncbi:MoaD/ThiS family protein [Lacipirellula parvula]|uniref:MoaD/ThiS family protein n=1 Tax=Lacipirellula parvula TaxID=2650471 RepID=UPI0015622E33|nr:MoaD/ThiS family protein [Lacipirellula parvula]
MKLFAAARELAGCGELPIELPVEADVAALRTALCATAPALAELARRSLIAINEEYAADATRLQDGDVAALIPPVSGG